MIPGELGRAKAWTPNYSVHHTRRTGETRAASPHSGGGNDGRDKGTDRARAHRRDPHARPGAGMVAAKAEKHPRPNHLDADTGAARAIPAEPDPQREIERQRTFIIFPMRRAGTTPVFFVHRRRQHGAGIQPGVL